MSRCQVAGNVFPVGSSQGAASALQRSSCHTEVICRLKHRDFTAFPSTLLKTAPDFHFTGTCSLVWSWRSQTTGLSYKRWNEMCTIWQACLVTCWAVFHEDKFVPAFVIRSGHLQFDVQAWHENNKANKTMTSLGSAMGVTRGHRWLDEVALCCRKSVHTSFLHLLEVRGGIMLNQHMKLKEFEVLPKSRRWL